MWLALLAACNEPRDAPPKPTEQPVPTPAPVPTPVPVPTAGYAPPPPGTARPAADADLTLEGDTDGDLFGDNVEAPGDVNGDGRADAWIGAKGAFYAAGAGYLYVAPFADAARVDGELPGDFAGGGLAGPGDVNGDGLADLLIGGKLSDRGADAAGAAWLLHGPLSGGGNLASAAAIFPGEFAGDEAGGSLAGSPDLLLIAATAADFGGAGSGSVYLVPTPTIGGPLADHVRLDGLAAGDNCGGTLAFLGDISGDGLTDFAVACGGADPGGLTAAGEIWLFTHVPAASGPLSIADGRIAGTEPLQVAGAVASAGDLTGDGHDDVLVGAPGDAAGGFLAGAAFVLAGPLSGEVLLTGAVARLQGEAGDWAGFAVGGAGDVDGDGATDALIGGPGAASEAGVAWWVPGPIAGVSPLADVGGALTGVAPGDGCGHAVAGLGDANGDGFADLLIGGPGAGAGAAYVLFGGPGA